MPFPIIVPRWFTPSPPQDGEREYLAEGAKMATMLTWHKVGQKVTMSNPRVWNALKGVVQGDEPEYGRVYMIVSVRCIRNVIYFQLKEVRPVSLFDAASFVPVYPTIVEQLRRFEAPEPETVTEDEREVVAS